MNTPAEEPTLREYVSALQRRKWTIVVVFLVTTAAIAAGAYLVPPSFTASARLLVKFGREFMYGPDVAASGGRRAFSLDEMINSEVEILGSRDLAREVVERIGIETLYPEISADEPDPDLALAKATATFQDHLSVAGVFDSSVIRASFEHTDPRVAASALNLLLDRFKDKHLAVFGDSRAGFLQDQLAARRAELERAERALADFKRENRIFEIVEQKKAILSQRAQLESELRTARFRIAELEGQLEALEEGGVLVAAGTSLPGFSERRAALISRRERVLATLEETRFRIGTLRSSLARLDAFEGDLAALPVTGEGGRDRARPFEDALIRLLDLEIREKDALRTRREESRELTAVRAEIALVKRFLEARRHGVKAALGGSLQAELVPLESRRAALEAERKRIEDELESLDTRERTLHARALGSELSVLRGQERTLAGEIARLNEELAALDGNEVELHRLERERLLGEESVRAVRIRYEEARIADELDERKLVNIRLIEKAAPPISPAGLSRKMRIALGAVAGLIAGIAAAFFLELLSR